MRTRCNCSVWITLPGGCGPGDFGLQRLYDHYKQRWGSGRPQKERMDDCVDDDEFIEIEDVPVGSYPLHVGGNVAGVIDAFEMHDGEVYGHIKFRDPEVYGREHLDFEPRGQKIEIFQGDNIILEIEFPAE